MDTHPIDTRISIRCKLPSPSDRNSREHPIEVYVCIGWTENASADDTVIMGSYQTVRTGYFGIIREWGPRETLVK